MMRIATLAFALFLITWATVSADISDYHYASDIVITNSTGSDITTRVRVSIPANTMVSNGYIQGDADDVTVLYGSEEPITCTNLTSDASQWLLNHTTIPAGSSVIKEMHFGDPTATRDQWWVGDADDTIYAPDDATLDIVSSGTISLLLSLPGTPASTQYVVSKYGNYRLGVKDTGEMEWEVWKRDTLSNMYDFPSGNGHSVSLTPVGASTNYQAVQTPDGDTSYVTNLSTSPAWDYYDISRSLSGVVISSISVNAYARRLAGYSGTLTMSLYLDGNTTVSSEYTLTDTYVLYSATLGRPGGGSWTTHDLERLEMGIQLTGSGGVHISRCTAAWVAVFYYDISSPNKVSVPVQPGTVSSVTAGFDGAKIVLAVNGVSSYTTVSGTLNANTEDLLVAECDASIDHLMIQNNGSVVLDVDFEPEDISATTITDASGAGNNLTYTLASNPAGISVNIGLATSTIDVGTSMLVDVPPEGIVPAVSTSLDDPDDDTGKNHPLYPLVKSICDSANMPVWVAWILMYLVTAVVSIGLVMKYVPHLGLAIVAVLVVTMAYFIWGLLPWWLVAMVVMGGIASLVMERRGQI